MQRQPEMEEEKEEAEPIQTKPAQGLADSFKAGEDVESGLNQSKGGGSPLPDSVRGFMEPRFGMDFSHVRAHTGSEAVQMNRDVGAKAFTHGSDIYYGAGNSPTNLELTAHELTHVVQQTGGMPLQAKRAPEAHSTDMTDLLSRLSSAKDPINNRAEKRPDQIISYMPQAFNGPRLSARELTHASETIWLRPTRQIINNPLVQRNLNDGHNLSSNRFSRNAELEKAYDNQTLIQKGSKVST